MLNIVKRNAKLPQFLGEKNSKKSWDYRILFRFKYSIINFVNYSALKG